MHKNRTCPRHEDPVSSDLAQDGTAVFACQLCGQCCHGKGGIVLRGSDQARLAAFLALPLDEFLQKYTRGQGAKVYLSEGADECCVFFTPHTLCTVHEARPDICRAWPFFRGNLVDPVSLSMAKEYCPGISKSVPFARFAERGAKVLAQEGLGCQSAEHNPTALTQGCISGVDQSSKGKPGT